MKLNTVYVQVRKMKPQIVEMKEETSPRMKAVYLILAVAIVIALYWLLKPYLVTPSNDEYLYKAVQAFNVSEEASFTSPHKCIVFMETVKVIETDLVMMIPFIHVESRQGCNGWAPLPPIKKIE